MGVFRMARPVRFGFVRLASLFIARALIYGRSIAFLYLLALVALFVAQGAFAARTIIVEPSQLQRTFTPGTSGFAFSDSRSWTADVATQRGSKVNVPVLKQGNHGWPGFRAGLKNLLKVNPARAAATTAFGAAMVGLDWVMNEGAISTQQPDSELLDDGSYWNGAGGASSRGATPKLAAIDHMNRYAGQATIKKVNFCTLTSASTATCNLTINTTTISVAFNRYGSCISGTYNPVTGACVVAGALAPVTDSQLDDFLSTYSDPQAAAELAPAIFDVAPNMAPDAIVFTGPPSVDLPKETTVSTDPATGQTTVTETLPSVQLEYGTDPLSVTATPTEIKNEYQDGVLTNTSTTTITSTSTSTTTQMDIPTDCAFMPTVCAFIDWVKTPFNEEEPDFSQFLNDDEDFKREVTISGNATCPAPLVMSTSRGDFEFSFQPACTFAGMFKPLFITLCLLGAIYITLGAVRGGED